MVVSSSIAYVDIRQPRKLPPTSVYIQLLLENRLPNLFDAKLGLSFVFVSFSYCVENDLPASCECLWSLTLSLCSLNGRWLCPNLARSVIRVCWMYLYMCFLFFYDVCVVSRNVSQKTRTLVSPKLRVKGSIY